MDTAETGPVDTEPDTTVETRRHSTAVAVIDDGTGVDLDAHDERGSNPEVFRSPMTGEQRVSGAVADGRICCVPATGPLTATTYSTPALWRVLSRGSASAQIVVSPPRAPFGDTGAIPAHPLTRAPKPGGVAPLRCRDMPTSTGWQAWPIVAANKANTGHQGTHSVHPPAAVTLPPVAVTHTPRVHALTWPCPPADHRHS